MDVSDSDMTKTLIELLFSSNENGTIVVDQTTKFHAPDTTNSILSISVEPVRETPAFH